MVNLNVASIIATAVVTATSAAQDLDYDRADTREASRQATLARYMPSMQWTDWNLIGPFDNTDLLSILIIEPEWMTATGERQHAMIITISTVDAPLAVRGQVIEHDALFITLCCQKILQG